MLTQRSRSIHFQGNVRCNRRFCPDFGIDLLRSRKAVGKSEQSHGELSSLSVMIHYRSILSIVLALIAVMVVNLGNVAVAKPAKPAKVETYTSQQLTEIQPYANALQEMRDRLPELADLIQKQDWTFTRNFIRGPLGEIRFQMLYLTRNLLPVDQVKARELAKKVADNLVSIDLAAEKQDYKLAVRNYAETVRDLDAFLALVPKA